MVIFNARCFCYFTVALTMYRAGVFNANRITVNDWRLLCLRKIIYQLRDQLNYSESHAGNLHHSDSIKEGYQYSMSKDGF